MSEFVSTMKYTGDTRPDQDAGETPTPNARDPQTSPEPTPPRRSPEPTPPRTSPEPTPTPCCPIGCFDCLTRVFCSRTRPSSNTASGGQPSGRGSGGSGRPQNPPQAKAIGQNVTNGADVRCCRICFDELEDNETGPLISPCQCVGSMRFVHVNCLNRWRAHSPNSRAYYMCDACKYPYRVERLRIATFLTSRLAQVTLTVMIFIVVSLLFGCIANLLFPNLMELLIDYLMLPPEFRLLSKKIDGKGNPACWYGDANHSFCCDGRGFERQKYVCEDRWRDRQVCCTSPGEAWRAFQQDYLLFCRPATFGVVGLSVVGLVIYTYTSLTDGGVMGAPFFVVWCCHFKPDLLGAVLVFVGSLATVIALYLNLHVQLKHLACRIGERVFDAS